MIYFVLDIYEDFAISSYDRYSAVWFFTVSFMFPVLLDLQL